MPVRTVAIILILFSGLIMAYGQSGEEEGTQPKTKPLSWDIHLGTGFSHMAGFGSGMIAYTAPTLNVPLNERWFLHGGIMVSHFMPVGSGFRSAGQGFQSGGEFGMQEFGMQGSGMQRSFSTISVFGAASYRMSDRLVLHGVGVKQLATTPLPIPATPFSPYQSDRLSLGATYRLGNNVTIGASIHMQQRNGYYTTPFLW